MSKNPSKKPNKILESFKGFFTPLRTQEQYPRLEYPLKMSSPISQSIYDSLVPTPSLTEVQHRQNMQNIELARLRQERETANNNLMSQHKVMIVTVIATFIALFSSGAAIFISLQKETPPAPVVNVTPAQQAPADINVYVPRAEQPPQE